MSLEDLPKPKGRRKQLTEAQLADKRAKDADRQRRKRQRDAAREQSFVAGEPCRVHLDLTAQESGYLARAMKVRALWSASNYDPQEYLTTLLLRDGEKLDRQLAELPPCARCGRRLPDSCELVHKWDIDCILTSTARELAL